MIYNITPVAKPRMTQRDKWAKRPCVMKYRAFKDECRLRGVKVENGDSIVFGVPMPKSWSKKMQLEMVGTPHNKRPDLDNFLKALMDATLDEDSTISYLKIAKVWTKEGFIKINRNAVNFNN